MLKKLKFITRDYVEGAEGERERERVTESAPSLSSISMRNEGMQMECHLFAVLHISGQWTLPN